MANVVSNLIEYTGITDSNAFPNLVTNHMFKQLSVQETVCIPEAKPDIEQITKISAEVRILSTRAVQTPKGSGATVSSLENQTLTGWKLIIEGEVCQKIEYVADEPTQSVHVAHIAVPFSAFIVLDGHTTGTKYIVTPYIEDIYAQQVGKRCIFKNITVLLVATK